MPFINVTLTEGRSKEQLRRLIAELTEATVRAIDAPTQSVRVVIHEVPETHWAAGNVTIHERKANAND